MKSQRVIGMLSQLGKEVPFAMQLLKSLVGRRCLSTPRYSNSQSHSDEMQLKALRLLSYMQKRAAPYSAVASLLAASRAGMACLKGC